MDWLKKLWSNLKNLKKKRIGKWLKININKQFIESKNEFSIKIIPDKFKN